MRIFGFWLAFVLGLYVLQSALLPLIAFHGVSADLLLLLVVSYAFQRGPRHGILMGFLAGSLQDLATGTFFGVDIFAKMAIGYAGGYFSRRLFKEQVVLPMAAVVAATVVHFSIVLLLTLLLGYRIDAPLRYLPQRLLPMLAYNLLFALPVNACVRRMCERLRAKK